MYCVMAQKENDEGKGIKRIKKTKRRKK